MPCQLPKIAIKNSNPVEAPFKLQESKLHVPLTLAQIAQQDLKMPALKQVKSAKGSWAIDSDTLSSASTRAPSVASSRASSTTPSPVLSRCNSADDLDVMIQDALEEVQTQVNAPARHPKAPTRTERSQSRCRTRIEEARKKDQATAMSTIDARFSKRSVTTLRKEAEAEAKKKAEAEEAKRKEEEKKALKAQRAAEEEKKRLEKVVKELEMERWSDAQAPTAIRLDKQPSTPSTPSAADSDEIPSDYADLELQIDIEQELQRKFETMDEEQLTFIEDADVAVPRYLKQVDKTMPQVDLWVDSLPMM